MGLQYLITCLAKVIGDGATGDTEDGLAVVAPEPVREEVVQCIPRQWLAIFSLYLYVNNSLL